VVLLCTAAALGLVVIHPALSLHVLMVTGSGTNSSELAVRFRLQVETELEQLEGVLPAQKTEPH
jgi:hypothetical protein